jgi:phosphoglycolate phosphatase-like HAD superfamily hydrolase
MTSPQAESADSIPQSEVVFLLDCDNTLLDNDGVKADMDAQMRELLGATMANTFWREYEEVRRQIGTVDLPLTFERFDERHPDPASAARLRSIIMDYPFASRLYPETLATIAHLKTLGLPTIVSDGDSLYQPHKIEQSGLAAAVNWQAVIYARKEDHLEEIITRWPATFYVAVDDKGRILTAFKNQMPDRFVTVQVMEGHYAQSPTPETLPPDISIASIGELQYLTLEDLRAHLRPR